MKRILNLAGIGILAATAMLAQPRDYQSFAPGQDYYAQPQFRTYGERNSYHDQPAYQEPQVRDDRYGEGNRDSYYRDDRYRDLDRDRDGDRDGGYGVERERSFQHSAAIVGGGAALGAIIGGIAGHGQGAAIGALSGGAAGFIYDRITRNHVDRY